VSRIIEEREQEIFFLTHPELVPKPFSTSQRMSNGSSSSGSSGGLLDLLFNTPSSNSSSVPNIPYKDIKLGGKKINGSFFSITLGTVKTKEINGGEETPIACKYLKGNFSTDLQKFNELFDMQFLCSLKHPAIEKTYGMSKNGQENIIVAEACLGGTLERILLDRNIKITLKRKIDYCFYISSAILYINELGYSLQSFMPTMIAVSNQALYCNNMQVE